MDAPLPPGWHDIVRRHVAETAGHVVAQRGDCLEIQTQETRPPRGKVGGRDFQPLSPDALLALKPPPSWFVGIILCPGDDLKIYALWHTSLDVRDRDRVVLFIHREFQDEQIDEMWSKAKGSPPLTVPLPASWPVFHRTYGRLHGDRVFLDHTSAGKEKR